VFYSSKTSLKGGEPLQAFTAVGRVADQEPYQAEMAPGFVPWRRDMEFVACTETSIRPLVDALSFIKDKQRRGYMPARPVRDFAGRLRRDHARNGRRPVVALLLPNLGPAGPHPAVRSGLVYATARRGQGSSVSAGVGWSGPSEGS
jgi:hypothetical protein